MADDWTAHAACRGATALFFDVAGETHTEKYAREAAAKAICETCPVTAECLEVAEYDGVWGGTTARDRVAIRRRIRAAAGAKAYGPLPTSNPAPSTVRARKQRAKTMVA